MEVHHTGQRGGEPHPVGDGPVAVEPDHLVLLGHIVEETEVQTPSISALLAETLPFLVIGKKCVRHPDFFRKISRKG